MNDLGSLNFGQGSLSPKTEKLGELLNVVGSTSHAFHVRDDAEALSGLILIQEGPVSHDTAKMETGPVNI